MSGGPLRGRTRSGAEGHRHHGCRNPGTGSIWSIAGISSASSSRTGTPTSRRSGSRASRSADPVIRVAVAVVGDGPAGAAVALALLARGVEVAVLGGRPAARVGEHLAPSAWSGIEALALGPRIDTGQHRTSPGVASAWGGEEEKRRDYLFQPWLRGLNLDRAAFDRQLL